MRHACTRPTGVLALLAGRFAGIGRVTRAQLAIVEREAGSLDYAQHRMSPDARVDDALVSFGRTEDAARRMTFRSLYPRVPTLSGPQVPNRAGERRCWLCWWR